MAHIIKDPSSRFRSEVILIGQAIDIMISIKVMMEKSFMAFALFIDKLIIYLI
jgi:hypothetical protein